MHIVLKKLKQNNYYLITELILLMLEDSSQNSQFQEMRVSGRPLRTNHKEQIPHISTKFYWIQVF